MKKFSEIKESALAPDAFADEAADFCRTVLKMGSRDNLFDKYMKKHKMEEFELASFMAAVANTILKY